MLRRWRQAVSKFANIAMGLELLAANAQHSIAIRHAPKRPDDAGLHVARQALFGEKPTQSLPSESSSPIPASRFMAGMSERMGSSSEAKS